MNELHVLINVWTEQWILIHAGGYIDRRRKSAFTNSSGETNTNILDKLDIKFDLIHGHLVNVSFLH